MSLRTPSDVGLKGKLFGRDCPLEDADLVVVPVPWDGTVTYRPGTKEAPREVLNASSQLDAEIPGLLDPCRYRPVLDGSSPGFWDQFQDVSGLFREALARLEAGNTVNPSSLQRVREAIIAMEKEVYSRCVSHLERGSRCGLLGGDHGTCFGLVRALSERGDFGILHIDAHMDLRESYAGITRSHASIMRNIMEELSVKDLTQVGVRDYCAEELDYQRSHPTITTFFDQRINERLFEGETWGHISNLIVETLPPEVYISLDIDGLSPDLSHATGTPVPGGISFAQFDYLLGKVARSRSIVGFDLCEVNPSEDPWEADVGARLLYRLCMYTGASNGLVKFVQI